MNQINSDSLEFDFLRTWLDSKRRQYLEEDLAHLENHLRESDRLKREADRHMRIREQAQLQSLHDAAYERAQLHDEAYEQAQLHDDAPVQWRKDEPLDIANFF